MDPLTLIPTPEAIPAPAWLFTVLELLTFTLHILVINVIWGGALILLVNRFRPGDDQVETSFHGALSGKIPTMLAIGINLGVAPLLFIQVLYGHLMYTSSVLMAVYWIMVIPLLILAYYAAYIHARKYSTASLLSKSALVVMVLFVSYIGLMLVNNITLMEQPAKWTAYFQNRGGTILNLSDPTLIPRYLHFLTASVAIAGLFLAIVWHIRGKKGVAGATDKVNKGLLIFGVATAVQFVIGFWLLIALPSDYMLAFMGKNLFYTLVLVFGLLMGLGALVSALMKKLYPTLIHLILTVVAMVILRYNVRELYLAEYFDLNQLQLAPQYGVMTLFFVVFVIGLGSVAYMINIALNAAEGGTA